jgi:hypothetical protein
MDLIKENSSKIGFLSLNFQGKEELGIFNFNICEREFPFRKIGNESERKGYYFSQDIDLSAGRQK